MTALHRLLARQVRHVERVPRGQEGLDPDEWHRFLAGTDPPDLERRDELVSVG